MYTQILIRLSYCIFPEIFTCTWRLNCHLQTKLGVFIFSTVTVFQTLDMQLDEYMSGGYFHTDFRFHQKLLDVQIISNRRIRQNVRECREMYADRHNPLYSRKKYKTIEVCRT